jgi:hypothetical protein
VRVAICIPTYRDKNLRWGLNWENFLSSLPNLRGITNGNSIVFALNFNGPWEDEQLSRVLSSLGSYTRSWPNTEYTWTMKEYRKPVSMAMLREDTSRLCEHPEAWLHMDDDFIFRKGAGEVYAQCIAWMQLQPKCGAIMCMGTLGGYRHGNNVVGTEGEGWWWLNRGLLLRNICVTPKHIPTAHRWLFSPPESWRCRGTWEEFITVYERMEYGYFPAKRFNVPVTHKQFNMAKFKEENAVTGRYPLKEDLHNPAFQDCIELIRERYGDEKWTPESRRVPKGLKYDYEPAKR